MITSSRWKFAIRALASLSILALGSCVSPVDEANKLASSGSPDAAYQHIVNALASSPNNEALKTQQVVFGDQVVADLIRQAEGIPPSNLTGRDEILKRAQGYASTRKDELAGLRSEIAARKAELAALLQAQDATPTVAEVLSALAAHAAFFREDSELNAALEKSLGLRLMLHSRQLATNRDYESLLKLRTLFSEFGLSRAITPELNAAIESGIRGELQRRISGIINLEHRGESALWATLLDDAGGKLRLSAVILGTTDETIIEPLRAQLRDTLGTQFRLTFIADRATWAKDSDLLIVIEVKDSGFKVAESSGKKSSKYVSGTREEPNPAYLHAQTEFNNAKASDDRATEEYRKKYEDYVERLQQARMSSAPTGLVPVQPPDVPPQSAPGAWEKLQATPRTIRTVSHESYDYTEKVTTAEYFGELAVRLTLRADELVSVDFVHADRSQSIWRENLGVHPQDQSVLAGDFRPGVVQAEAAGFMTRLGTALAGRMKGGMQDLAQRVMQSAVQRRAGQSFALGAALACAAAGPLNADEAYPFLDTVASPGNEWRSEAVWLALERANVAAPIAKRDLTSELMAPSRVTEAAAPAF